MVVGKVDSVDKVYSGGSCCDFCCGNGAWDCIVKDFSGYPLQVIYHRPYFLTARICLDLLKCQVDDFVRVRTPSLASRIYTLPSESSERSS